MKILYVNYGEDDVAFEARNDFLFPWLEGMGYLSTGKDDDEWPIPDEDVPMIEEEIERFNQKHGVTLRADWADKIGRSSRRVE